MKKFSGKILKLKREEKNLSLEDISRSTKISKRILKKIEVSDFSNMSYFQKKYFIKNYSKILGIETQIESTELFIEKNSSRKDKNSRIEIFNNIIIDSVLPKILIPILILTTSIIIFYTYEKNSSDYLERLSAIDNKLSESLYKELDISTHLNDLPDLNNQLVQPKVKNVSAENISVENIHSEILLLYFGDEVWVEIENDHEILLSRVFQKNDEISLEILQKDNVFITSGNLGLITVKTNYSGKKVLGLNGEIGRKKLF